MLGAVLLLLLAQAVILQPGDPLPCAVPCPLPPPRKPRLEIVIRQELRQPLSPAALQQVSAEARQVWRPYVDIDAGVTAGSGDALSDDTLELVLTDRVASSSDDGIGWIEFVDGEPAKTISVSMTVALKRAATDSWQGRPLTAWPPSVRQTFIVRALGRAVAHEVGHYLLRSKTHTTRGLMRRRFSVEDVMRARPASYQLAAAEVARLEKRTVEYLLARLGPAPAAVQ